MRYYRVKTVDTGTCYVYGELDYCTPNNVFVFFNSGKKRLIVAAFPCGSVISIEMIPKDLGIKLCEK